MEKTEKYRIVMTKFIGYDQTGAATYEITFNKSLEHTGRYEGIEKGLNDYCKKERRTNVSDSFKTFWHSVIKWIKN